MIALLDGLCRYFKYLKRTCDCRASVFGPGSDGLSFWLHYWCGKEDDRSQLCNHHKELPWDLQARTIKNPYISGDSLFRGQAGMSCAFRRDAFLVKNFWRKYPSNGRVVDQLLKYTANWIYKRNHDNVVWFSPPTDWLESLLMLGMEKLMAIKGGDKNKNS